WGTAPPRPRAPRPANTAPPPRPQLGGPSFATRNGATSRGRPAPSATRTAISRRLPRDRASNRFATLAHAISNTTLTAASISISAGLVLPTRASRKDRPMYSDDWLLLGYSSASPSEIELSSALACSSETPGLSLASAKVQFDFRADGAWTGMLIGRMTSVGLLSGNRKARLTTPTIWPLIPSTVMPRPMMLGSNPNRFFQSSYPIINTGAAPSRESST